MKPGGKAILIKKSLPETSEDQKIIYEITSCLNPLKSETNGHDPFFAMVPVIDRIRGPKFKEAIFQFEINFWSEEKLMQVLKNVGFENARMLKPKLTDYIEWSDMNECRVIENHYVFIAAEK